MKYKRAKRNFEKMCWFFRKKSVVFPTFFLRFDPPSPTVSIKGIHSISSFFVDFEHFQCPQHLKTFDFCLPRQTGRLGHLRLMLFILYQLVQKVRKSIYYMELLISIPFHLSLCPFQGPVRQVHAQPSSQDN